MKCKYCNTELSDHTQTCSHCGRFLGDPNASVEWGKKKKRWLAIGIIGTAIAFVLTTFGYMFTSQKTMNENLTKHVAATAGSQLGMPLDKFKEAFNDNEYAKKLGFDIGKVDLVEADNRQGFEHAFNDRLVLTGVIGKADRKLVDLRLVARPNDSKDDLIRMVTTMGILIDIFSPDIPMNDRKTILQELGFNKDTDLYKVRNTTSRGNRQYSFEFVDKMGFVFSISARRTL